MEFYDNDDMRENYTIIAENTGESGSELQIIEEMSELTKAIIKLRRVRGEGQPTNITEKEALENIYEEIADIENALETYKASLKLTDEEYKYIENIKRSKQERCLERFNIKQ